MKVESRLTNGHAVRSVASASRTILLALNLRERALFFRDEEDAILGRLDAEYSWVDTDSLNEPSWERILRANRPEVLVTAWSTPAIPLAWALDEACSLRYVCHITGSVRNVVSRRLIENGLLVSNWGSSISFTIAEHAMLLILGALRGTPRWSRHMASTTYSVHDSLPDLRTRSLKGKRVGLHGFGAVARDLVALLRPYQVSISAYSEPVPQSFFEQHGVTRCRSLAELFASSDVLIECESLTPESRGSVSEEILELLPEDAVFVNIARGALVDEEILLRLALAGRIRVALDVYNDEPLPSGSPWFDAPCAFLSPHIAGPTWDTYPLCGQEALRNVANFLSGNSVQAVVSPSKYDLST